MRRRSTYKPGVVPENLRRFRADEWIDVASEPPRPTWHADMPAWMWSGIHAFMRYGDAKRAWEAEHGSQIKTNGDQSTNVSRPQANPSSTATPQPTPPRNLAADQLSNSNHQGENRDNR